MKILVTGANGYLGQGIIKQILDKGHKVIASDFTMEFVDERAEKIEIDLFQAKFPYEYFGKPDILLHLAWRDGFMHYSDMHIKALPKHYTFIKQMAEAGVKKIAVMGSMHEIGFWEGSINEFTPCRPVTPYGISKNALRGLTQMLTRQYGNRFQWLRGYYIVGNLKFGSSVFSKIASAAERNEKNFPFTSGQNQYDFINYEDFCRCVAAVIVQDKVDGIIEVCSGKPEKLADRIERFIDENEYDIRLDYGAFPERPYDSKAIWGNSKKLEKILKDEGKV